MPETAENSADEAFESVEEAIDDVDDFARTLADNLYPSDELRQALQEEEGALLTVYRDSAGKPTVGTGHLIRPEDGFRVGDRITEADLQRFLDRDLETATKEVRQLVGDLPLSQHEFDALVDLVFNIGGTNLSGTKSPKLHDAIRRRDYSAMADQLSYTKDASGRPAPGLIHRSERRRRIFAEKNYDDPRQG